MTWTATWDDVRGLPSTATDSNADVFTVTYDAVSRPIAIAVNSGAPHLHYEYNWRGPRPSTTAWSFDGRFSDLATSTWQCTGPGWRDATAYANGAGEALFSATTLSDTSLQVSGWTERNERGQVVLTAEPFTSTPQILGTSRPSGARVQTSTWDALGRLTTQTASNGAQTRITYGAFSRTTSSPEQANVTSQFDGLGRIIHTERTVGTLESLDATYIPDGSIATVSLQGGLANYLYQTNGIGRLYYVNDVDSGTRILRYDDRNLLIQETNDASENTYFEYDGAGRLTRRGGETSVAASATGLSVCLRRSGCCRARPAGVTSPAVWRRCSNQRARPTSVTTPSAGRPASAAR